MDKKKPTYDLGSIKTEFCDVDSLRMTRTARNDAFSMGFTLADVVVVIQSVTREHFYKSMTSDRDHTIWQDVYHVPANELILYVKFTHGRRGEAVDQLQGK